MMDQNKTRSALPAGNPYPGRGIVVGQSADVKAAVWAYFIMGRSDNSRNRVLATEGDSLYTRPYDDTKVQDPSLIIYRAAKRLDDGVVVTNGDQTDTICDGLASGKTFMEALDTRTYEPDRPNYTPRISAMLSWTGGAYTYKMSILRRQTDGACERAYWRYTGTPGVGHILHTYQTDGDPLPSFVGAPREVEIGCDFRAFADILWNALDKDNRIALYVCRQDLTSGETQERLYNKHQKR